jgi:2-polyprenyl-3-methyl-5-hydroxy-6-metoxy-1,4-benzoquinol methylase
MIFTNPQPPNYVQQVAHRGVLARHLVPEFLERLRRTARFVLDLLQPLASGSRLLDFGCGEGVLVHEARRIGWNAIGLDLNQGLVHAANAHWGFAALLSGSLDEFLRSRPDPFDVIVTSQVFEHLQQPVEFGRQLVSLLKPSGLLYIDVPNVRQLGERLARGRTLDPTAHWNHFSLATLSTLVTRLGCNTVYASGAPSLIEYYHRARLGPLIYPLGRLSKRLLPGIGTGVCVVGRVPS